MADSTPTDELNRLLDALEGFAYYAGDYQKETETDLDIVAARAAIVAHFEKVMLTPEEAGLVYHAVELHGLRHLWPSDNPVLAKLRRITEEGK